MIFVWNCELRPTCPLLFSCVVVSLQASIVRVKIDIQAVGEVAGLPEVLQEVHAVAPAAVATAN